MPSFFDLQKYAATGIASADMTAFDKARALAAFGGGKTQTMTGVPPLSFRANGKPLISWSMLGNTQQTGTHSPQSIIMPTFCGVRTANLWSEDYTGISETIKYVPIYVGNGDVTISTTCGRSGTGSGAAAVIFLLAGSVSTGASTSGNGVWNGNDRTVLAVDGYVTVAFRAYTAVNPDNAETMLNLGSTALPYEPYGYKLPITCGGQTTPVYLGQTQTVRKVKKLVFDGTESWSRHTDTGTLVLAISGSDAAYLISGDVTCMCTHYPAQENVSSYSQMADKKICIRANSSNVWIRDTDYSTSTEFKTYLQQQYAAGTPVTVWYVLATPETTIVNEPLCKIGDYADELHSEDTTVSIPTVKGQNTLTVDTELPPSEISITGHIKEV